MIKQLDPNKFIPMGDRIIVEMIDVAEKSSTGGIILAVEKSETPTTAVVKFKPVSSFNEDGSERYPFVVGEVVQFGEQSSKGAGTIVIEGNTYHILNGTTIYGYFHDEEVRAKV